MCLKLHVIIIPICSVEPQVSCCTMAVILYRKACHTHTSPLIALVLFHNEKLPLVATCNQTECIMTNVHHHSTANTTTLLYFNYSNNLKSFLCFPAHNPCHLVHAQGFGYPPQYNTDTIQDQNQSHSLEHFLHTVHCLAICHLPT